MNVVNPNDPPVEGLVWSPETDELRGRWEFQCSAAPCVESGKVRGQGYAPADKAGGVTEREAEHFGWRKIDGKWICPFCSGNLNNLKKLHGDGTLPRPEGFQQ